MLQSIFATFLPNFYVSKRLGPLLPMADFINLAGEARDFEQANIMISTGQIYPTNPPEAMRAYYDTIYDIPSECNERARLYYT